MKIANIGSTFFVATLLSTVTVVAAHAATNIDLSPYYNQQWSNMVQGSTIAAAPTNGNTGTGMNFADWSGQAVVIYATAQTSLTINFTPATLLAAPTVNALFNTAYGSPNVVNATIVFQNSLGQTATFSLVGDQTLRDYNDSVFANTLPGSNTNSSYGAVTTKNWWEDGSAPGSQRLDVSTFDLPTSWAGTKLDSMTISDPFTMADTDDIFLSALQISDVPEPSSLPLLALSLFGLYVGARFARRRSA